MYSMFHIGSKKSNHGNRNGNESGRDVHSHNVYKMLTVWKEYFGEKRHLFRQKALMLWRQTRRPGCSFKTHVQHVSFVGDKSENGIIKRGQSITADASR